MASHHQPNSSSYDKLQYQEYLTHRNLLIESQNEQYRSLDKYKIALSTSAIGLSFLILTNFDDTHTTKSMWSLVASWISLGICLATTLSSFYFAAKAYDTAIDQWDEIYSNETSQPHIDNELKHQNSRLQFIEFISLCTFYMGIIALCIFVYSNTLTFLDLDTNCLVRAASKKR